VPVAARQDIIATLKPIGFQIAYSYTLFRKGEGPRDPFYGLF
jgi:hypothetical protein